MAGENQHSCIEEYNQVFGPDADCSVVMPEDLRDGFVALNCLQYDEPDLHLANLLRRGYKPLIQTYL